ncbi:MAG: hypothetical protein M0031_11350 [Thermaerobacter sp.]|nr:hypothetical protein [Thermaerobacter sp.]
MRRDEVERYLRELAEELSARGREGEILLVGGAAMLLSIGNREATRDLAAYLGENPSDIREAARAVAARHELPEDWLNDAVKGFFFGTPPQELWAEYPGLRVFVAKPEYVLAMKAVAGRPQDVQDLVALIQRLGLSSARQALDIVERYVPEGALTPRVRYLLEDLFESSGG